MDAEETTALTEAMLHSGRIETLDTIRPKIDKHSTGGVGDKVSIILVPMASTFLRAYDEWLRTWTYW